VVKSLYRGGPVTATTDDVDALIAAKITTDELFAELDAAFWRDLAAIRKSGGVGVNEICRRLHAAGIASKPTTLNKLSAAATSDIRQSVERMGTQFRDMVASLERNADALRRILAEAPEGEDN
jgi:phage-related protein